MEYIAWENGLCTEQCCSSSGVSGLCHLTSGHHGFDAYQVPKRCPTEKERQFTWGEWQDALCISNRLSAHLEVCGDGFARTWDWELGISSFLCSFIPSLTVLLAFSIQSPCLWCVDAEPYPRAAAGVKYCWQNVLKWRIEKCGQRWKLNKYLEK